MKFNFKKIASVLATTVMLGSTVAFATAAWPAPFVSNGSGDAAIVVGSNAPITGGDMAAAVELGSELDKSITVTTGNSAITGGDSVKLAKDTNKFNLGDNWNSFYSTLDNEDLGVVLSDGIYLNDDNNEYDYEQTIVLGNKTLTFFQDSSFNDDKPIIGFNLDSSDHIMNYTLDFTPDNAEAGSSSGTDEYIKMDNTDIKMLGKTFYISDAEYTSNGIQLTLLDSANTATIAEGETETVSVGTTSYEVSNALITGGTSPEVKLTINGEVTNSLNEGETYKLKDGTYVGIKDIFAQDYAGGIKNVEFSLGMGKLVLENGQEVQINDEDISTLEDAAGYTSVIKAYITNTTATTIDKIVLDWDMDDDAWVAPGTELIMPGFNAIKISMASWTAPKQEMTSIQDSGDSAVLTTMVQDGELDLPLLYANSGVTAFEGLGEKTSHKLVTNSTPTPCLRLNETENSYFVATYINGEDGESYAYELTSITDNTGKNTTKLKNMAGGSDIELETVGDTEDRGEITFTLSAANDAAKTATVCLDSGSVANKLVTKEGLTMKLPVNSVDVADGNINISASPTSWVMNLTEEDKDGALDKADKSFTLTVSINSGEGTEPTATSLSTFEEEDGSNWDVGYKSSDLATKVRLYNPSSAGSLGQAEVTYAGEQSYADVFITESAASVTGAGKVVVVKDNQVDSVKSKNLIVVGGSCINTVAASMLGSTSPLCGADFTAKTNVAAGQYLIKVASSPVNAEKVAMLIAGYEAADTTTAVAKVKEGKTSTDVHEEVGPMTV